MDEKSNDSLDNQTLIQALDRLNEKYVMLKDLARTAIQLNQKLNRIESEPEEEMNLKEMVKEPHRNIVQLFNYISDKMEVQIDIIGSNINKSIRMID